jgi:hypothetical protein
MLSNGPQVCCCLTSVTALHETSGAFKERISEKKKADCLEVAAEDKTLAHRDMAPAPDDGNV